MHRVRLAFSQVNALSWLRPGSGIPSISTAYAQDRRRCAQVIHMFVHRQQEAVLLPGWRAAADRPGRACVPGAALGTRLASPGSRRAMSAVSRNAPVSDGATRERELPWATRPELSDRSLATRTTPLTTGNANDTDTPVNYKPDQFGAPLGAQLSNAA
jgi:hypothetical protein